MSMKMVVSSIFSSILLYLRNAKLNYRDVGASVYSCHLTELCQTFLIKYNSFTPTLPYNKNVKVTKKSVGVICNPLANVFKCGNILQFLSIKFSFFLKFALLRSETRATVHLLYLESIK